MACKSCMNVSYERTYKTLGSVALPPSKVRPSRSLAVVAFCRVNDGAALLQTKSKADATRLSSISEADNLHDRYSYWMHCEAAYLYTSYPTLDI